MRVIINRLASLCRNALDSFIFGQSAYRYNLQLLGPQFQPVVNNKELETSTIFEQALWFAAPKSKISPSRKKMKHLRFIPDPINWVKCERCGESKIPLRMCTKNKDICVMRDEDYEIYKRNKAAEAGSASAGNKA